MARHPDLRLIPGGGSDLVMLGPLEITVVSRAHPTLDVDATVVEEDTHRVLGAPSTLRAPGESHLKTLTDAYLSEPLEPGSVLVKPGRPLQFVAIVYDLDVDSIGCSQWIETALRSILRQASERRLSALSMPLLGVAHGVLEPAHAVELIRGELASDSSQLERVYLMVNPTHVAEVLLHLR